MHVTLWQHVGLSVLSMCICMCFCTLSVLLTPVSWELLGPVGAVAMPTWSPVRALENRSLAARKAQRCSGNILEQHNMGHEWTQHTPPHLRRTHITLLCISEEHTSHTYTPQRTFWVQQISVCVCKLLSFWNFILSSLLESHYLLCLSYTVHHICDWPCYAFSE